MSSTNAEAIGAPVHSTALSIDIPNIPLSDPLIVSPLLSSSSGRSPQDTSFVCYHCLQKIDPGRPIYMRHDFPFCSKVCRQSGIAPLYRLLMSAEHDARAASLRDRANSLSSLGSSETPANFAGAVAYQAKQWLQKVVRTASTTSLGSTLFRTYSTGLGWGKDLTRNTSFNVFFNMLPDIDALMTSTSPPGHSSLHLSDDDESTLSPKPIPF